VNIHSALPVFASAACMAQTYVLTPTTMLRPVVTEGRWVFGDDGRGTAIAETVVGDTAVILPDYDNTRDTLVMDAAGEWVCGVSYNFREGRQAPLLWFMDEEAPLPVFLEGGDGCAYGVTPNGVAVGHLVIGGKRNATIWPEPHTPAPLHDPQWGESLATGVSGGWVCGVAYVEGLPRAVVWPVVETAAEELPPAHGDDRAYATGVNADGIVVGCSGDGQAIRPCVWINGECLVIGAEPGYATGINNAGQIVGTWVTRHEAWLLDADGLWCLSELAGKPVTHAHDIDERGRVSVLTHPRWLRGGVLVPKRLEVGE
jgi:hypothetical protein